MRPIIASLALAAAVLVGTAEAEAQPAKCFKSWSEAAQVVKQERLVAVEQLSRFSEARLGGTIVKSTLCEIGRRFLYRLIVRPALGPLRSVAIDARQPFDGK